MRIRRSLIIIVFFHELLVFINSFLFNLKGAEVDATRFQDQAVAFLRTDGNFTLAFDAEFYVQFLAVIFKIFGESEFIAAQFNVISTVFAYKFLNKISIRHLNFRLSEWALYIIFLYPTYLPKVTTTMRESFMLMFFLGLILASLDNRRFIVQAKNFVGVFFHKLFVIYFPIMIFLRWGLKKVSVLNMKNILATIIVIVFSYTIINQISNIGSQSRGLLPFITLISMDTETADAILESKSNKDARATYGTPISFSSPSGIFFGIPLAIIYYLFLPMPWMVSNFADILAFGEVAFRSLALILIILNLKEIRANKEFRTIALFCFVMIFFWSLGTTNYGTASRHNIITNWFFITTINFLIKNGRSINYRPKKIRNDLAL